jgi:peroxiredoxin
MPNVKKNYAKYHDKGFEVVGVSLDQDVKPLKKFLQDENITWPILFPQDKKDQGWKNPLAVYYGVNGIPCVILINQEGKVVSLNARGPELSKKLEELLGKAEDKDSKGDDKKADKSASIK